MSDLLAPCVAVIGPPHSGKTTLLHILDRALQRHPSGLLAYVVKGSPDGSGRYQFYNPKLREDLKPAIKGAWNGNPTIEQIVAWIRNARRFLDLALLDFGGKHDSSNYRMLQECTHYIVVARRFADPADEDKEGMNSWRKTAEDAGLEPLALISSICDTGDVAVVADSIPLRGTFRGDAGSPEDTRNAPLVEALTGRLLALRLPGRHPAYLNLNIGRWNPAAVDADMAPLIPRLRHLARSESAVRLGGAAPVFAYLRAMHLALDENPDTAVEIFDPKVGLGFVPVPPRCLRVDGFPSAVYFKVEDSGGTTRCEFQALTIDRFLPFSAAEWLAYAPPPPVEAAQTRVVMSSALPIWLHAAYSRWLREAGTREIGVWDANTGLDVIVRPAKSAAAGGQ